MTPRAAPTADAHVLELLRSQKGRTFSKEQRCLIAVHCQGMATQIPPSGNDGRVSAFGYIPPHVERPFSHEGNPDLIELEGRHPSAEEQEHVAARFQRVEEELTAKEREKLLHPTPWLRLTQL